MLRLLEHLHGVAFMEFYYLNSIPSWFNSVCGFDNENITKASCGSSRDLSNFEIMSGFEIQHHGFNLIMN